MPGQAAYDEGVRRRVLGWVGLGLRGRLVVTGTEQVKRAAQKGGVQLVLLARDASRHSVDKLGPLLRARGVEVMEWPSAAELGGAVGRETTVAIGIVDQALARGIRGAVSGASPAGDATRVSR